MKWSTDHIFGVTLVFKAHRIIPLLNSHHLNSECHLLWWHYPNWGPSGDHEPRVQRLGECGLNSVKKRHSTRTRHAVEGQASCPVVQIHSYGRGAECGYFGFDSTVPKGATSIGEGNAPGLGCVSKATFCQLCPFIAHSDLDPWPLPFNLPVTNSR